MSTQPTSLHSLFKIGIASWVPSSPKINNQEDSVYRFVTTLAVLGAAAVPTVAIADNGGGQDRNNPRQTVQEDQERTELPRAGQDRDNPRQTVQEDQKQAERQQAQQAARAQRDQRRIARAREANQCTRERRSLGVKAFRARYGTPGAFRRCVAQSRLAA